jgi:hypothetical protein
MMVARGYQEIDGLQLITVNDPAAKGTGNVYQTVSYRDYVARNADHGHWNDFYNISPVDAQVRR